MAFFAGPVFQVKSPSFNNNHQLQPASHQEGAPRPEAASLRTNAMVTTLVGSPTTAVRARTKEFTFGGTTDNSSTATHPSVYLLPFFQWPRASTTAGENICGNTPKPPNSTPVSSEEASLIYGL